MSQVAGGLLSVEPKNFVLSRSGARQSLLVTAHFKDGKSRDVTAEAAFHPADPEILTVDASVAVAKAPGTSAIAVDAVGMRASATGQVLNKTQDRPFSFDADIAPIFTKNGCSGSQCHGSLNGQHGFHLSVFGYDPAADYAAVVKGSEGRRVNLKEPEKSLILAKPTFQIKHGGGKRFAATSPEYIALLNWLKNGAPQGAPGPKLVALEVFPKDEVFLTGPDDRHRVVVVGTYADGEQKDLTRDVSYTANDDEVLAVDSSGLLTPKKSGETAVMIRLFGVANVVRVAVSFRAPLGASGAIHSQNLVDAFTFPKMHSLGIVPSELATDNEFLRRVYLDLIGTLPRPAETAAFLADSRPDKRARLIESLFQRTEFANFWAVKWGDQFTNSPEFLYDGTAYFQQWLRKAMANNMPYDEFARALVTSTGSRYEERPSGFYGGAKTPLDLASFTSQTFMGVSLECARCHDHPREKWKRADFHGLAAFFAQVSEKNQTQRTNEVSIYIDYKKEFEHPETKAVVRPKFPGEDRPLEFEPGEDRRDRLAAWLTSPKNPYFAPAIVNRVWKQFMGRGIVEPEDFRITNPPTHPELLAKLSEDFIEHGYDLRHLMRTILNSRTYQLSSQVNETNRDDSMEYSHYYVRRLTAEQLADAVSEVTGVPERYPAFPAGKRAIELPDEEVHSNFLDIFDRPARQSATCTRKASTNITQMLNLMNGDSINSRIKSPAGTLARLLQASAGDRDIVGRMTLAALARPAKVGEIAAIEESVKRSASRRSGLEDYLWALLNSKEFLYNH